MDFGNIGRDIQQRLLAEQQREQARVQAILDEVPRLRGQLQQQQAIVNEVPALRQQLQQQQAIVDQVPALRQQLQTIDAQVPVLQQQLQQLRAIVAPFPALQQELQQLQATFLFLQQQNRHILERYQLANSIGLAFAGIVLGIVVYQQEFSDGYKLEMVATFMMSFFIREFAITTNYGEPFRRQLNSFAFSCALIFLGTTIFYERNIELLSRTQLIALVAATLGVFLLSRQISPVITSLPHAITEFFCKWGIVGDQAARFLEVAAELTRVLTVEAERVSVKVVQTLDTARGTILAATTAIRELTHRADQVLVGVRDVTTDMGVEIRGSAMYVARAIERGIQAGRFQPQADVVVHRVQGGVWGGDFCAIS